MSNPENEPGPVCQDEAPENHSTDFNGDNTMTDSKQQIELFMWGLDRSLACAKAIFSAEPGEHTEPTELDRAAICAGYMRMLIEGETSIDLNAPIARIYNKSAWQIVHDLRDALLRNTDAAAAVGWRVTSLGPSKVQP